MGMENTFINLSCSFKRSACFAYRMSSSSWSRKYIRALKGGKLGKTRTQFSYKTNFISIVILFHLWSIDFSRRIGSAKRILAYEQVPIKECITLRETLYGRRAEAAPRLCHPYRLSKRSQNRLGDSICPGNLPPNLQTASTATFVDICPQNSTPVNAFHRKLRPHHRRQSPSDGKTVFYQNQNEGAFKILGV
jgi:hypothetical protein